MDTESGYLITPNIKLGRLRLVYRWMRFACRSLLSGDWDFVLNAFTGSGRLVLCWLKDVKKNVQCNICGWQGCGFYPNIGPGYYEKATVCPRCLCQDRHRSLVHVLGQKSEFFSPEKDVLEVAPMRSFQLYSLKRKQGRGYLSFDFARFAMERGDITDMRYADNTYDYFLCFHVLEHIVEETKAMSEIRRVLRPGGVAIFQVPVDETLSETLEYDKPDPRETGHVRRYARDFAARIETFGFSVEGISVDQLCSESVWRRHGFSLEPIYLATKVERP